MGSREYLVGVLAFVLLIWGDPIDHSWPAWLLIRTAYLIAIPTAAWFALSWIWKVWRPDAAAENRLSRTLAGATAGVLLVGAVLAVHTDHHFECTQEVRTRDGSECVGDYVLVPGPDFRQAFLLTLVAGFAFGSGTSIRMKPMEPRKTIALVTSVAVVIGLGDFAVRLLHPFASTMICGFSLFLLLGDMPIVSCGNGG